MIPLRISLEPIPISEPIIARLKVFSEEDERSSLGRDAIFIGEISGVFEFKFGKYTLRLKTQNLENLDGDVILISPGQSSLHRLIRNNSKHNTFLVTEQCDQLCVMCSQPPKKYHYDLFQQFFEAVELAPQNAVIGLSGGEPLLHKQRLFELIEKSLSSRPDVAFHVLTNGQHFAEDDRSFLDSLPRGSVLWGIPIYADTPELHDRIVAKKGAFSILMRNLALLASVGAQIELRTVVLRSNALQFESLSHHISKHLSFIEFWAIMQLESIGYGRQNWDQEFFDSSILFNPIGKSIDLAVALGILVKLYNFPLCTLPEPYRQFSVRSISDWKQKYLENCDGCNSKSQCGGFFEWYPSTKGFEGLRIL
ncbi:MAG: His-Xaa-Ser system radical SAM maturase HxsC [Paracoccaceae bacterium]